MTTKLTTVRDFLTMAKEEGLFLGDFENLEQVITSQTDGTKIIGDELMGILLEALREANALKPGVYTTAAIIIGVLK